MSDPQDHPEHYDKKEIVVCMRCNGWGYRMVNTDREQCDTCWGDGRLYKWTTYNRCSADIQH